jgi:hypothetical protein
MDPDRHDASGRWCGCFAHVIVEVKLDADGIAAALPQRSHLRHEPLDQVLRRVELRPADAAAEARHVHRRGRASLLVRPLEDVGFASRPAAGLDLLAELLHIIQGL